MVIEKVGRLSTSWKRSRGFGEFVFIPHWMQLPLSRLFPGYD